MRLGKASADVKNIQSVRQADRSQGRDGYESGPRLLEYFEILRVVEGEG